eukprot:Skav222231  [mRNA]  locus=scaffold3339:33176:38468:+ [translate_table: standard]
MLGFLQSWDEWRRSLIGAHSERWREKQVDWRHNDFWLTDHWRDGKDDNLWSFLTNHGTYPDKQERALLRIIKETQWRSVQVKEKIPMLRPYAALHRLIPGNEKSAEKPQHMPDEIVLGPFSAFSTSFYGRWAPSVKHLKKKLEKNLVEKLKPKEKLKEAWRGRSRWTGCRWKHMSPAARGIPGEAGGGTPSIAFQQSWFRSNRNLGCHGTSLGEEGEEEELIPTEADSEVAYMLLGAVIFVVSLFYLDASGTSTEVLMYQGINDQIKRFTVELDEVYRRLGLAKAGLLQHGGGSLRRV